MPADEEGRNDRRNVVVLTDTNPKAAANRLPSFIKRNAAEIVGEWVAFAQTLIPSADGMSPHALRDHIHQILTFIVLDMASYQTLTEQIAKSRGEKREVQPVTASHTCRRALRRRRRHRADGIRVPGSRASVSKLWSQTGPAFDAVDIADMIRFNESIDQELAESVNFYTDRVAQSRELVVGILGHDLRSPLQAIVLSTEPSLHMGQLNERQTTLSNSVYHSVNVPLLQRNTKIDIIAINDYILRYAR